MAAGRKGKSPSKADWKSSTDPELKIGRMKDETAHLAYKPEHSVDLDTGRRGGGANSSVRATRTTRRRCLDP
jgi:hypothetical protein